jgi:site-specific DNA-methyltransferase (adenine-specific)
MANNLYNTMYNPDVLSCIANLSNDEVFTPPEVANAMLDLLPQELFSNPDTTFLDPACKSGVFLREIAKRLLKGLEPLYPDLQERTDHIFKYQLYGITITELTSHLSRRSLYCSKFANGKYSVVHFDNIDGNVRFKNVKHSWGKTTYDSKGNPHTACVFCGASKEQYDRDPSLETHAYEMIHTTKPEDIFNMKFDVIISNPPYQLTTNSTEREAAKQARPIFQAFVENAKKLSPRYLTMIIPARWYSGGIGLGDFRETMVHDRHVTKLVDYVNSRDCFTGVDIAGGVCYFLWERDAVGECQVTNISAENSNTTTRSLDEFGNIFIRSNESIGIIHKIRESKTPTLDSQVFSLDPFGFPTSARGQGKPFSGCLTLVHSKGNGYIRRSEVGKNKELIDKWKVTIARIVPGNGEVGVDPSKGYKAITTPRILPPGTVNTFSYMLLGAFDTEKEAENFRGYMMCKLPRFLLRLTYSSMNIAKQNFMFVPKLDFQQPWNDALLYELFGLSDEEIALNESTIRPMDGGDE